MTPISRCVGASVAPAWISSARGQISAPISTSVNNVNRSGVWKSLGTEDRVRLVATYLALAGGLGEPMVIDRSPADGDPLWAVVARRVATPS